MAQPFITVDHVSYTYPAGENETAFPAVRDISFSVERGAFVAILGHNGSGKSTLAKLLNMILVPDSGTITVDGERVNLTPKEYDLLFYLIQNKNIALSRDKLLSDIWGYDFFGDDRTIDTHIKNLRNNLGPYRNFIVTLRGVGYKFEYDDSKKGKESAE